MQYFIHESYVALLYELIKTVIQIMHVGASLPVTSMLVLFAFNLEKPINHKRYHRTARMYPFPYSYILTFLVKG